MNFKTVFLFIFVSNSILNAMDNEEIASNHMKINNGCLTSKDMENPKEAAKKLAAYYERLVNLKIDADRIYFQFQHFNRNESFDAERQMAILERVAGIEVASAMIKNVPSENKKVEEEKKSCMIL